MNAPVHPAGTSFSWFAPLDPALGPSDPPRPAPPWSEFRPASPAAAAWELCSATGAGLILLLMIVIPAGHAEYVLAYGLTALATLVFWPGAIVAGEPRSLEERLLAALTGLASGWFYCAKASWGGQDLAALALAAFLLCSAWLNFHRARLCLPREY